MKMSNHLDLIRKIKALAERGEGGEQINAQRFLQQLLKKHNVSLADLETEAIEWRRFIIPRYRLNKQLWWQCAIQTLNGGNYRRTNKRDVIYLNCTASQQMEILAKYKFYSHYLEKDLDAFLLAFVWKNEIFAASDSKNERKLTLAELEQQLRASELKKSIKKYQYDSDKLNNETLQIGQGGYTK